MYNLWAGTSDDLGYCENRAIFNRIISAFYGVRRETATMTKQ